MNVKIEEYLYEANPWWQGKDFHRFLGVERESYVSKIYRSFKLNEVKVLFGVRRSGKSTMIYQLIARLIKDKVPAQNIIFINFDNNIFSSLTDDPVFLDDLFEKAKTLNNSKGRIFLFLDEIQEIPGWERWVNKIFEQKKNIHIMLTGSSSTLQSTELSTLLTGRNLSFEISTLNFKEYLFFKTGRVFEQKEFAKYGDEKTEIVHYFNKYLEEGGFPAVVLADDDELKKALLRQYFQDIIYRDLVRKYKIRSPKKLENLAIYLISNIGRALSYRNIAGSMGIAVDTLKEYIDYFERAGFFSFLSPFTFSTKQKLREMHNRKIYVADHGFKNVFALNYDQDSGFVVENIIYNKLKTEKLLGYTDDPEIDFAFNRDRKNYLVQVSFTNSIPQREFDNFEDIRFKKHTKLIISANTYEDSGDIKVLPAWYYLLMDKEPQV